MNAVRCIVEGQGSRVSEGVAGVGTPGDAWVMVETSIDLRASPAWMHLDGALGQMAGDGAAATPATHHPTVSSEDGISDPGAGPDCSCDHCPSPFSPGLLSLFPVSSSRKPSVQSPGD